MLAEERKTTDQLSTRIEADFFGTSSHLPNAIGIDIGGTLIKLCFGFYASAREMYFSGHASADVT